jgi:streptogramin lyase
MTIPTITELPEAPSRADDGTSFSTKADAFVAALPGFRDELIDFGNYLDNLNPAQGGVAARFQNLRDRNVGTNGANPIVTQPPSSSAIAGTRTSATVFTRSAGTWTVDALIGQWAFSHASGTVDTGTWLQIIDNDASTVTISGTLHATGTGIITCPFNPTENLIAHGKGGTAFIGCFSDGSHIWFSAYNSNDFIKVSIATGIITSYTHGLGATAFRGGCFDGENVWFAPHTSTHIYKINVATGTVATYAHGQTLNAFAGCCFDGRYIWFAPYASANIVRLDPTDGSMTTYAHGQSGSSFMNAIFDGIYVWFVPYGSANILKLNPADGSFTAIAHGQGATAYRDGCCDGESIWLIPYSGANITKVNPFDNTLTHYAHGMGATAFQGAVWDYESVWAIPYASDYFLKINPEDGTFVAIPHGQGPTAFGGACFDMDSIWIAAQSATNIVRMRPPRFGREKGKRLTSVAIAGVVAVKEGAADASMGTAVLVGGTVVVSTTRVTANSRIFLTNNTNGGTAGFLRVSARTAGTSFTITSSSGTDTSTIAWWIVEPAL